MYDPNGRFFKQQRDAAQIKTRRLEREVALQRAELARLRRQVSSLGIGQTFHTLWFVIALVLFALHLLLGAFRPG